MAYINGRHRIIMKHCERAKEVVTDHGRNGHFTVQFDSKLYKIRARHLDYLVQF